MSGRSGNQLVLFSLDFVSGNIGKDSGENKTNCFPRDLALSVVCFTPHSPVTMKAATNFSNNE